MAGKSQTAESDECLHAKPVYGSGSEAHGLIEPLAHGAEADPEVMRQAEAVAGRDQHASLGELDGERPRVPAVDEPGEGDRAAGGLLPADDIGVRSGELIE